MSKKPGGGWQERLEWLERSKLLKLKSVLKVHVCFKILNECAYDALEWILFLGKKDRNISSASSFLMIRKFI